MKFNIKDVARKAGVSISTVSRVVNNSKAVRPKTRDKVMQAIEELGYKPNAIARSLKVKNTKTIGIMIPDISNQFFPEVVRGVEDVANMYEYNIFLCNTDLDQEKEVQYFDVLEEKQVDGIIFMGNIIAEDLGKRFKTSEIPTVLIGTDYEDLPSITIDNIQAGKDVVKYLLKKGHEKIAMITGKAYDSGNGMARKQGYAEALEQAGLKYNEAFVVEGGYRFKSGYEGAKKLLKLKDRPTAIFVGSDEMAIGAMRAALEEDIAIPEELAIVGFDNIDMAGKVYPSLSTIAQPMYEMGAIGMRVLTKILHDEVLDNKKVVLNHSFVERESS
ncbi:transcriptional regulator, LacI family [Clostridium aceticum]|uniref:Transcriptional regulator, LacI family n=1 Tax=Clostridium aceticum TaxID=84022 RepID=A0A0D8IHA4_9CLOT|nr:LacI family DNA-binding transcriptional regulator [Clostridium aceticum]AKL94072.1 transcriptional regulator, LacI family [Clostridium aceticum]KJF28561.1 catabolite control protein A [Clostridium aceticum]